MKHKFKRFFQKIGIFLVKKVNISNRQKLTKTELEAGIVFRKLVKNKNTELLISPYSGKCYLRNNDKNILIVLSSNNISIINHIFGYDISIPNHLYENLRNTFNETVEFRRSEMEEEYRSNVRHSIQQVIKSLKNE
jgi:hypothetical protein